MAVGLSVVFLGVLCLTELADLSMASSCLQVGGVDNAKLTAEQLEAQQNQTLLSCNANLTGREHFIDDVLAEMGLSRENNREYYTHVPTFINSIETCRAAYACPDAEPIWCINVYHPSEHIQMCMNTKGIINATNYARLLQLQCYFNIPTECPSGQPDCISVTQPTQMLDRSVIACSVSNESAKCSSTSVLGVFVEVTGHETEKPLPRFENSTELVLGQTNLLLCVVFFAENRISTINSAQWFIDDVPVQQIHEMPYCYLDEFVYVAQAFAPSLDVTLDTLFKCYGTGSKLILHYCKTPAWG